MMYFRLSAPFLPTACAWIAYTVISFSYFIGMYLGRNPLGNLCRTIGGYWLIAFVYLLIGYAAADIGEFFDPAYRKIRIMPFNVTLDFSGCKFIGLAGEKPGWIDFPVDVFGQKKKNAIGFAGEKE